jgi:hypothetical protein
VQLQTGERVDDGEVGTRADHAPDDPLDAALDDDNDRVRAAAAGHRTSRRRGAPELIASRFSRRRPR